MLIHCKDDNKSRNTLEVNVEPSMVDGDAIYLYSAVNGKSLDLWIPRKESIALAKAINKIVGDVDVEPEEKPGKFILTYIRSNGKMGKVWCDGVDFEDSVWSAVNPKGWIEGGPVGTTELHISRRNLSTFVGLEKA